MKVKFRSQNKPHDQPIEKLEKMLQNLPILFNSTQFLWGTNATDMNAKKGCVTRPQLIDIKERILQFSAFLSFLMIL